MRESPRIEQPPWGARTEFHRAVEPTDHLALIEQFRQPFKQRAIVENAEGSFDPLEIGANLSIGEGGSEMGAFYRIARLDAARLTELLLPGHQGPAQGRSGIAAS